MNQERERLQPEHHGKDRREHACGERGSRERPPAGVHAKSSPEDEAREGPAKDDEGAKGEAMEAAMPASVGPGRTDRVHHERAAKEKAEADECEQNGPGAARSSGGELGCDPAREQELRHAKEQEIRDLDGAA